MKTIVSKETGLVEVKKSRFHGMVIPIDQVERISPLLKEIRQQHPKARHICYAYRIWRSGEIVESAYDDGEPRFTAGQPILWALRRADLVNVIGIVIRYFGGILLGKGGLIRAYGATIRTALSNARIVTFEPFTETRLTLSSVAAIRFEQFARRHHICIRQRHYTPDGVTFQIHLPSQCQNEFEQFLKAHISGNASS